MGITGDWDRRITPPDAPQDRRLLRRRHHARGHRERSGVRAGELPRQSVHARRRLGRPEPDGRRAVDAARARPARRRRRPAGRAVRRAIRGRTGRRTSSASSARAATVALPDEAHSVRVELDGLAPENVYFYRFKAGDEISPVGRTRTGPPGNSMVDAVTLRLRARARTSRRATSRRTHDVADAEDIEAVIFLGDYIYEGRPRDVRTHAPQREVRTLDEYRIRHGQYKTDDDLQAAHAAHPWLVTWDDHEFKNNYADEDLDPDRRRRRAVRARRAAAYRAYWEHMPLARARKPEGPDLQLYRRFHWGKLATFNVLDGRQYRSDQPQTCLRRRDASGYCVEDLEPRRTMLGAEQREWLLEDLADDQGALERPCPADGVRAAQPRRWRSSRDSPSAPTTGRGTSPSVRRSSTGSSSTDAEPRGADRRLAPELGPRHPAGLHEFRRTRSRPSSSAPRSRPAAIPIRSSSSSGDP